MISSLGNPLAVGHEIDVDLTGIDHHPLIKKYLLDVQDQQFQILRNHDPRDLVTIARAQMTVNLIDELLAAPAHIAEEQRRKAKSTQALFSAALTGRFSQ